MIHQPLVINLNRIGYLKGNIVIYWNSPYSFIKCSCTNKVVGWCCVLIVDYLINQILSFVLNNQEHHSLLFSKDPPLYIIPHFFVPHVLCIIFFQVPTGCVLILLHAFSFGVPEFKKDIDAALLVHIVFTCLKMSTS